jgi:hypothetical protein
VKSVAKSGLLSGIVFQVLVYYCLLNWHCFDFSLSGTSLFPKLLGSIYNCLLDIFRCS